MTMSNKPLSSLSAGNGQTILAPAVTADGMTEAESEVSRSSSTSSSSSTVTRSNSSPPPAHLQQDLQEAVQPNNMINTSNGTSKGRSLQDRSRIPPSLYVTVISMILLQYFGGIVRYEVVTSWCNSIWTSSQTTHGLLVYLRDMIGSIFQLHSNTTTTHHSTMEYIHATCSFLIAFALIYVFFLAPFQAGLWTGPKAKKHQFHRYMGLAYLLQYFLAWIEFATNYENGAQTSYLPHTISLNGLLQGISAYISFKVLPELEDAGYYSDKAVMSRNFVHENIFFSLMTFFGSIYYNESTRLYLQSSLGGKILEYLFVFWPYVAIRTWFPITRFLNAGTTIKGRSDQNEKFYQIATTMVKIFFLWAKYFLGFYMNFFIFLQLGSKSHWKMLHGMLLLNIGTVSLAMFLHTLRFKKVLPPRFTFSLYLVQIYLTFSAIPLAYDMFTSHPALCGLALAGLLCNMTRNRKIHAVWCLIAMLLLGNRDYAWMGRTMAW